jgi:hypothetical protein
MLGADFTGKPGSPVASLDITLTLLALAQGRPGSRIKLDWFVESYHRRLTAAGLSERI